MAQSVEHVIGNDEVISSILITSSKNSVAKATEFFCACFLKHGDQTVPVMTKVPTPGVTTQAPVVGSCA